VSGLVIPIELVAVGSISLSTGEDMLLIEIDCREFGFRGF
jgi:hypothetical protein